METTNADQSTVFIPSQDIEIIDISDSDDDKETNSANIEEARPFEQEQFYTDNNNRSNGYNFVFDHIPPNQAPLPQFFENYVTQVLSQFVNVSAF